MQRLTWINPVSLAKVMGVFGLFVGLVLGVIYGLLISVMGVAGGSRDNGGALAAGGIAIGLIFVVAMPILYGIIMFIAGLIYGLVIDLALWMGGGLEMHFERTTYDQKYSVPRV